jgi:hypothetical protein
LQVRLDPAGTGFHVDGTVGLVIVLFFSQPGLTGNHWGGRVLHCLLPSNQATAISLLQAMLQAKSGNPGVCSMGSGDKAGSGL